VTVDIDGDKLSFTYAETASRQPAPVS
jgi:hypothetical protein